MVSINNDLSKVERIIRTCYWWAIKTYIANLKIQDFLGLGWDLYVQIQVWVGFFGYKTHKNPIQTSNSRNNTYVTI